MRKEQTKIGVGSIITVPVTISEGLGVRSATTKNSVLRKPHHPDKANLEKYFGTL